MHIADDLAMIRRVCLYVGSAALVTGCLMTAEFGRSMSWLHAASLCLLSVVAAIIWPYVTHLWHSKARPSAAVLGTIGLLFVGVEYFSHLGYTIGHRVRDTEESGVQNTKYDDARRSVRDNEALIATLSKQLEEMQAQHPWAATVSADGLRAKLEAAQKAVDLESARGGCKSKCLALMKDKAALEERIKLAEARDDLTKRIAAGQRAIDGLRKESAAVKHVSSKIVNQTRFVSQLATMELKPGEEAMTWSQIAIGALIALVTTFMAPICFYIYADPRARSAVAGIIKPASAPSIVERITVPSGAMVPLIKITPA